MNKVNKSRELEHCDFVKLMPMCFVVLYHSMALWKGNWFIKEPEEQSHILKYLSMWFNTFHIYGFALVSGYIFQVVKFEKHRYQIFFDFLINKAKRLLVPLYFTSFIWVIPFYALIFKPTAMVLVKKFVLMESPSQLWFLGMLFVLFLIYWSISNFLNKNRIQGGGLYFLFIVLE